MEGNSLDGCAALSPTNCQDLAGEHRTQEVAGSSPASSIGSPCKRGCFFAVAAALRLAAFG
jgi:hypothetical protein